MERRYAFGVWSSIETYIFTAVRQPLQILYGFSGLPGAISDDTDANQGIAVDKTKKGGKPSGKRVRNHKWDRNESRLLQYGEFFGKGHQIRSDAIPFQERKPPLRKHRIARRNISDRPSVEVKVTCDVY